MNDLGESLGMIRWSIIPLLIQMKMTHVIGVQREIPRL